MVRKFLPSAVVVVLFILFLAVVVTSLRAGNGSGPSLGVTTSTSVLSSRVQITTQVKTSAQVGQVQTTQAQTTAVVIASTTIVQSSVSSQTKTTVDTPPVQTDTALPPATTQYTPPASTIVLTAPTDPGQTTTVQNGGNNPVQPPSQTTATTDSPPIQTTEPGCQSGCGNQVPEFPVGMTFVFLLAVPLLFLMRRATATHARAK